MRFVIASEVPGRLRLRLCAGGIAASEARGIEARQREVAGVGSAEVHTANETLLIRCAPSSRGLVLAAVRNLDVLHLPTAAIPEDQPELSLAVEQNRFAMEAGGWWCRVRSDACCSRFRCAPQSQPSARCGSYARPSAISPPVA